MAFTTSDDLNILQASDTNNVGAGAGNDTYIINSSSTSNGQTINITDTQGTNVIKIVGGVTIASSVAAANVVQLTLSNGAVINVLGADAFTFEIGGDAFTTGSGTSQTFTEFVTQSLGIAAVPTGSDTATGNANVTTNTDGTVTGGATTATFALTAGAASVDEGATATFNLATTNVADGTSVAYTLTGIDAADLASGSLTGTTTVTGGAATISVALAADTTTEGAETLTVSIDGQTATASTTVNDTSVASSTFTLTTSTTDTIAGTTADDAITGVVSGLSSTNTLQTTDKVDGAAGNDTLTVSMSSDFSGFGTGSLANVETLDITNTATLSRTFDGTGTTGVTTYKINANDVGFTLSDVDAAGKTVEITNADEAATINVNHVASAVTGSSDALTLKLTDVGTAKTSTVAAKELSFASADIETLTVESAGTSNDANISLAGTKTVTITGAGSLTSSGFGTSVTSLDASAATGAMTLTEATTSSFATGKTGAGDDTLTVKDVATSATLDGGAGTDTLVFSGSSAATIQPTVTNFETLAATGLTGALVVSGVNTTGLTDVKVIDALGSNLTLASLPNTSLNVSLTDTSSGSGSETATTNKVVYTGAGTFTLNTSTAKSSATAKATDVEASAATSATINVGSNADLTGLVTLASATSVEIDSKTALSGLALVAANATTVNISSLGSVTGAGTTEFGLDKLQSMTLNVTGNVDLNNHTSTTIGKDAKSITVDASKVTGTVALDIGDYSAGSGQAQITGSTLGANTVIIGTGRNEIVATGGISNDAVTLFNSTTAVPVSGEGSYNINLNTVSSADTLTLGGAGNDTFDFSNATVTLTGVDQIAATTSDTLTLKAAAITGQSVSIGAGLSTSVTTATGQIGLITLNGTSSADTIDLSSNLTLHANQTLTVSAGAGNDTITGHANASTLNGEAGNDTITGGAGADTIVGGAGDDTITADQTDSITGGDGTDTVSFGATVDSATLTDADLVTVENITLTAAIAADFVVQTEALNITGSTGNDTITGGTLADSLAGGAGDDTFILVASADATGVGESITGGDGTDILRIAGTTAINLSDDTLATLETLELTQDVSGSAATAVEKVTLTAAQFNAFSTVSVGATDELTYSNLSGVTLAATTALDDYAFSATDTNVSVTGFTAGGSTDDVLITGTLKAALVQTGTIKGSDSAGGVADGGTAALVDLGSEDVVLITTTAITGDADYSDNTKLLGEGAIFDLSASTGAATDGDTFGSTAVVVGQKAIFVVADDGNTAGVYLFTAADTGNTVDAGELSLLGIIDSNTQLANSDLAAV